MKEIYGPLENLQGLFVKNIAIAVSRRGTKLDPYK